MFVVDCRNGSSPEPSVFKGRFKKFADENGNLRHSYRLYRSTRDGWGVLGEDEGRHSPSITALLS